MSVADVFLKIEGIEGESEDDKHKNELQIQTWSWGCSNSGSSTTGGGAGSGKVHMHDFHFTIDVGKHSPKLMEDCATGRHIKKCTLTQRKAGGEKQEFFQTVFTDVLIASYQAGGQGGTNSTLPVDNCTFNFSKVEIEYKPQKPDGSLGAPIKAGYDLKLNKKV
jgi:type VI secretion system secreted protein Hcp